MLSFFSQKWRQIQAWLVERTSQSRLLSTNQDNDFSRCSCRLLCVDDDPDFCTYLQRLASGLNIGLDKAYSIEEAKQKIEESGHYEAFLIDGHLPDGSGFELVAWIREKKDLDVPIAFLSRIYQDAVSFRLFKEALKVDLVLDKPISPKEVKHLFKQLCRLETGIPSIEEASSDDLLTDIKDKYQKSIVDKIERLEKMILDIQKNPSIGNLQVFKSEIHKIAGSSGSYGYSRVSELCKEMEKDLIGQIELAKEDKISSAWLAGLDDFFTQIKLNFQIIQQEEKEERAAEDFSLLPFIYIVSDDKAFLQLLQASVLSQPFHVLTESNPELALERLSTSEFAPQVLLANARYANYRLTGYDLIQPFYQKKEERISTVGLLVDFTDSREQANAIRKGIQFVLSQPLSMQAFLPLLEQTIAKFALRGYQILVVDDDPDICRYISRSLKLTGAEVRILSQFSELQETLEGNRFDAVLLDVNLEDEKSIKALNVLKSMHDQYLVVAMVTVTKEADLVQKVYEANVDEILFKPLGGRFLQKRLFDLFFKGLTQISQADRDPATGLFNLPFFFRFVQRKPFENRAETIVAFEMKKLFDLLKNNDESREKELLFSVSKALGNLLKKYEIAAYLGEGRFALLFKGFDPWFLRLFMEDFLKQLRQEIQEAIQLENPFRIVCSILPLPQAFKSPEQMDQQIQKALQAVESSSRQFVAVEVKLESRAVNPIDKRRVILISDQAGWLKNLQSTFEQLHFDSSLLTNLDECMREHDFSKNLINLPLIVLAGPSAISQGVLLLKNLSEQNHLHLPVLYLQALPSQDQLHNFLGEEGIDYLNNPFNLLIFIEKIEE